MTTVWGLGFADVGCAAGCVAAFELDGAEADVAWVGAADVLAASVDGVSDATPLDDAAATDGPDVDVPLLGPAALESMTGIVEPRSVDGVGVPRALESFGAAVPIIATSTTQPATAAAAAPVEITRPIRM